MRSLQQLTGEATDLARPDSVAGHIEVTSWPTGEWRVTVYVRNEFAFHHCDRMLHDGTDAFGIIVGTGHDLDELIDRMMRRVADAVADTPCEQVPA